MLAVGRKTVFNRSCYSSKLLREMVQSHTVVLDCFVLSISWLLTSTKHIQLLNAWKYLLFRNKLLLYCRLRSVNAPAFNKPLASSFPLLFVPGLC